MFNTWFGYQIILFRNHAYAFPKRQLKNLEIFSVGLGRPPKNTRKSEEHIKILFIVSQYF